MNSSKNIRASVLVLAIGATVAASAKLAPALGWLASAMLALCALLLVSALITPRGAACYVNNFGALNNAIILHDALAEFWATLLPVMQMSLNVASEVQLDNGQTVLVRNAKPGDTITFKNWQQAFNVYDVGAGGYNTLTNVTPADKPFVLPTAARACSIALTPTEYRLLSSGATGGADYNAFKEKVVFGMLASVGEDIVSKMHAVIVSDDFPHEIVSTAGTFDGAKELRIEKDFFSRKCRLRNPQMILDPTTFLEYTSSFSTQQQYTGEQIQKGMLFSGSIPSRLSPFTMRRTHVAMPDDASRGYACTKTAILGAFRIPDEPTWEGDPVSLATIVDSRKDENGEEIGTGIGALTRMWKTPGTGVMQLDIASIYKFEAGQPEALTRIVPVAVSSES